MILIHWNILMMRVPKVYVSLTGPLQKRIKHISFVDGGLHCSTLLTTPCGITVAALLPGKRVAALVAECELLCTQFAAIHNNEPAIAPIWANILEN